MGQVINGGVLEALEVGPQEPNAPRYDHNKVPVAPLDVTPLPAASQPQGGESRKDTPVVPQAPVDQRV